MSDNPLLDTLLEMTAASVDGVEFSDTVLMVARLAALVAVDAPAASYVINLGAAAETALTLEDARSVLMAVAPIVGTPRIVSAASRMDEALNLAIALDEFSGAQDWPAAPAD